MTPKEAKEFLRRIHNEPVKCLDGSEKEEIYLLLKLMTPYRVDAASQRFITEYFNLNGIDYKLTEFSDTEYEIEIRCQWSEIGL